MLALSEWQEKEKQAFNCAVDEEGCLLDNLTLELRVHPPEVHIDNAGDPHSTLVTIDSANRPGSLVFVSGLSLQLGCSILLLICLEKQRSLGWFLPAGGPALYGAWIAYRQLQNLF